VNRASILLLFITLTPSEAVDCSSGSSPHDDLGVCSIEYNTPTAKGVIYYPYNSQAEVSSAPPVSGSNCPVFIISHLKTGNANAYLGYSHIMDRLVPKGYIGVSIDWSIIESRTATAAGSFDVTLDFLIELNYSEILSVDFRNKLDLTSIHLAGHSSGGHEALIFCEQNSTNPSFQIKSLTLFAPVWRSNSPINTPFMLLAGTGDSDQPFLLHQQAFKNYSSSFSRKYLIELYGGNHGFFNNQLEESEGSTQYSIMSKQKQLEYSTSLVELFVSSIDSTDEQMRKESRDIISGRVRDNTTLPQEDVYCQSFYDDDFTIDDGNREVKSNRPHFIQTVDDHPTNYGDLDNMKLMTSTETFYFIYDFSDIDLSQYRYFSYKAGTSLANSGSSPLQTIFFQDSRGKLIYKMIDTNSKIPAFYSIPCDDDSIIDCDIFLTVTDLHIKLDEMENSENFDFENVKDMYIINHDSGSIYMDDLRFSR
jgi:hypothetical protein